MPQLADIVSIQQGLQFRGELEESPDGACRVIQIRDFDDFGELRSDWQEALVRIDPPATVDRYRIHPGDLLFLARGHRNFAWAVPAPMPDVVPVGFFLILRPDRGRVHPGYLEWFLNSDPARTYLRNLASQGTHMPVVNRGAFAQLPVPLPPLSRQAVIAEIEDHRRREVRLQRRLESLRHTHLQAVCLAAANHPSKGS